MTTCRHGENWTVRPTEQELQLSYLDRPGMNGGRWIKQILLPGKYAFKAMHSVPFTSVAPTENDVAEVRKSSVRRPRMIRIENVLWHEHQELKWSAYLNNSIEKIIVPVEEADDSNLGYYNCRILRPGDVISLDYRSILVDFIYQENYFDRYVMGIVGNSLIEQHEFAHVDTPLNEHSGYLMIGKSNSSDHSLELTAFAVKPRDNVYIPAKTIHTNDYLLGTWQTLLSSDCEFPSAQIKRRSNSPLRITFKP